MSARARGRPGLLARAASAAVALALACATHAHSELRSSVPPAGARLAATPPRVELRFNEPVQLTALRLVDANNAQVRVRRETGMEARDDARAALPPLAPGGYRLVWAAISADGHPIGGSIRFEVLASSPAAPPSTGGKPAPK